MLCHSEGTVTSLITDLLWHLTWLAPLFPYSCSIPLLPHSSWTIFGPHFSRHVSIAFRWRKTKDGPGDGAEGEREREVDVDARWLLSSSLQRALHQVSGLLYGVELLITRGEEEKWCFLFESSSFCLLQTQLGRHRLSVPETTQQCYQFWNSTLLRLTTWFQGWRSGPEALRLTWLAADRYENSLLSWMCSGIPVAKTLHQGSSLRGWS